MPYSATLEFVTCMKSFTDLLVGELNVKYNYFIWRARPYLIVDNKDKIPSVMSFGHFLKR